MDKPISVVIPTLNRPENIKKTFENLRDTPNMKLWYVCHELDTVSQELVRSLGANLIIDYQPQTGVNAANAGYWGSDGDWVVIAQDDIYFHDGWLEEAVRVQRDTGAKVVGLNDCYEARPGYSVCWMVSRDYVEKNSLAIGFPNVIFFPHYKKNYADNELNDTANSRNVFAWAANSKAEHMHPGFGKSEMDSTYMRNEDKLSEDHSLFESRRHLW